MISWHKVGQMVVCIDSAPWPTSPNPSLLKHLVEGDIYTFSRIVIDCNALLGVNLAEVKLPPFESYAIERFRPVRPTDIEQFRYLLTPSPEEVEELEDNYCGA